MSAALPGVARVVRPSAEDTHDACMLAQLQGAIDDLHLVTGAIMHLEETDTNYCRLSLPKTSSGLA